MSNQCKIKLESRNINKTIVKLGCVNITNNAGRNWTFIFGSKHGYNQFIVNHTFTVTLEPLPLKNLPSFDVTLNEELTSASIFVRDCDQVTETKYLSFQCGMNNNQYTPLPKNCAFTCPVKSESVYNISIIRLPIPRHNGTESKACNNNHASAIRVLKRTTAMFMCNISYDCLIINSDMLAVFKDDTIAEQCTLKLTYFPVMEHTNVIVTCINIANNAGRDWKFVFGSKIGHKSNVANETFVVTLEPFPLNNITRLNMKTDESITLASMIVPHCDQIAEMKYLSFRCGLDNNNQQPLPDNCTFTCPVRPGSFLDVGIIRHPIQRQNGRPSVNDTFTMESRGFNFNIGTTNV
ncbi:unnamed protein product [Rotaria sp. Silwood2]|nr:unnamed protein product [Rotaria sp. Silwood2]